MCARACLRREAWPIIGIGAVPDVNVATSLLRIAREHLGRSVEALAYVNIIHIHVTYSTHVRTQGLHAYNRNAAKDLVIRGGVNSRAGRADLQQRPACTATTSRTRCHKLL